MKVNLAMDWFGPDAKRYRKANNPQELPDSFRELLPKSAKIVEEEPAAPATPAPVKTKI